MKFKQNHKVASVISIILFFVSACSPSMVREKPTSLGMGHCSQIAIFGYLESPDLFLGNMVGKGKVKLDPILCRRSGLFLNGKPYFDDAMRSPMLKAHIKPKTYSLTIPDSLLYRYRYAEVEADYKHDYAIIHQFSPLLPTIEPGIYLVEHFVWANVCEDTSCYRLLDRSFLTFECNGNKVTYIGLERLKNQIDFIGFGGFPKARMEKAGENEKIQFGH